MWMFFNYDWWRDMAMNAELLWKLFFVQLFKTQTHTHTKRKYVQNPWKHNTIRVLMHFETKFIQSLLAKSAENMLLSINKHKWIIMLWHIYIWRKKRNTTKEKSNAKT